MKRGISVAIISVESKGIKSEEIYFKNKNNPKELSLAKDIDFKNNSLNIKNLFFISFNISSNKNKIREELVRLGSCTPKISKFFVICDKDTKSFTDDQIIKSVKRVSKEIEDIYNNSKVIYLEFEKDGHNFETFLKMHNMERKLFEKYTKTDSKIYEKFMGQGGRNYLQLLKNIDKYKTLLKYKELFKQHEDEDFD